MQKRRRIYIAAGLCLLAFLINELGILIGYLHMYDMLVMDAGLSVQALEASRLSFAPMLISSVVRVLIYLLLVLYCFCLNQSKAGTWLFALAFLLEAARCGRMFVDSVGNGFVTIGAVCFALMLVFCLTMTLLKAVRSKLLWGLGGIALGLYLLLTAVEQGMAIVTAIRNPSNGLNPWWFQIVALAPALCRIAGFALLWRQEKPLPPEPTPE